MDAVTVNGTQVSGNSSAIIDTGTTLVIGPPAVVHTIYAAIPGARPVTGGSGMWSVPCAGLPEVSFTFGGTQFSISRETFTIGTVPEDPDLCFGGISSHDDKHWLVGDVFLQNVYSTFDVGKKRVGFAQLA